MFLDAMHMRRCRTTDTWCEVGLRVIGYFRNSTDALSSMRDVFMNTSSARSGAYAGWILGAKEAHGDYRRLHGRPVFADRRFMASCRVDACGAGSVVRRELQHPMRFDAFDNADTVFMLMEE